jgi:hypothetical protein
MNNTPQVETREIADTELDNVSGGLVGGLVDEAGSILAETPVPGIVNGVVGTVGRLTGVDVSATVAGL